MQSQAPVPLSIDTQLVQSESPPIVDAHPYESIDPFAASISLRVRYKQRRNTITNVDEIRVPRAPPVQRPPSHRFSRPISLNMSSASVAQVPPEGRRGIASKASYSSLMEAPEIQPVATIQPQANVPQSEPGTPREGNTLDATIMTLEVPDDVAPESRSDHQVYSAHEAQPKPLWNPIASTSETRSTISSRHDHRRLSGYRAQYATFSEAFLPVHLDEKIARPNLDNSPTIAQSSEVSTKVYVWTFLTSILPRQIYLHCLLRLPYMYFSRVDQIFIDAHLSMEEIKEMALQDSVDGLVRGRSRKSAWMPRTYIRLKRNWEHFIDNLMREWKTLNIISGLLLSGILTIFQIEGVNNDPLTRSASLCSLICALLSLLYGCFFIIRFSGMRRVYRAAEWAIEAQHDQTMIWNVWVMLAMPAIWLVWSILAYVAAIMSFMWRIRPGTPIPEISEREDFALRVFVCSIFAIGVVYALLIIYTLRRYGSKMDRAWKHRIEGFRRSRPAKPSEDEPFSPDIIPPTPRAHTPLSSFSDPYMQLSTAAPQIPPSFTRRDEVEEHPIDPTSELYQTRPAPIISETTHASSRPIVPQKMPQTIIIPPDKGADLGLVSAGNPVLVTTPSQQTFSQSTRSNLSPVLEASEQAGEDRLPSPQDASNWKPRELQTHGISTENTQSMGSKK